MKQIKRFNKDFILVVIGQIISLFGNAILRFALPLYLLNQTHSAALFGVVSACSFIPMIILSPIGGIIADRINKRNIMVILDFLTAALALMFTLFMGNIDLIFLLIFTLIILYGIQGIYQPSVQASIPSLISRDNLMTANAIINLVNSLASLIGPVIGGILFGFWGIKPILFVSIICFLNSAIMELFIQIPFEKKPTSGSIFSIALQDMKESIIFIRIDKPIIGKIALFLTIINMFFSALLMVGLPVVITHNLGFGEKIGNQLYGYCQGTMATGGLLGGILAGTLLKKLTVKHSPVLLIICSFSLVPIGITLFFKLPSFVSYGVILMCCFIAMAVSTIFSIEMMSYVQLITPSNLIGKVMSLAMCACMCAQPLGLAMYGTLFEAIPDKTYLLFFIGAIISCTVALLSKSIFYNLDTHFPEHEPTFS